jgi:glycerol-3-phosphate dehydrogenase
VKGQLKEGLFVLEYLVTGEADLVPADIVISVSGDWIDKTSGELDITSHYVDGLKGSHLIVKHQGPVDALRGLANDNKPRCPHKHHLSLPATARS